MTLRAVFSAGIIAASACGELLINDCPVVDQGGDRSGLTYEGYVPGNCPVEVTVPASIFEPYFPEAKRVGANLSSATPSFSRAVVQVFNTRNQDVVQRANLARYDVTFAYNDFTGRNEATLDAYYLAASAWDRSFSAGGDLLSSSADDRATYTAFRNDLRAHPYAAVQINYEPSTITASVSGPDVPLAGSSGSWSATANGGTSPYTFRWYRNGEFVGGGNSYSASGFSSEFGLRLEASDQYNTTKHIDYWVDVDGVRGTISGPAQTWSSSVVGRGPRPYVGATPHTMPSGT